MGAAFLQPFAATSRRHTLVSRTPHRLTQTLTFAAVALLKLLGSVQKVKRCASAPPVSLRARNTVDLGDSCPEELELELE